ncbi:MAG: transcription elongation factor GreA [Microbacteriaceae bacterium]
MSAQWLNQESFDRLALELEQLTTVKRAEIVGRIEAARAEGDLKENCGYRAAKEEQGRIEARIRQLTDMLKNAHVGTEPVDASRVAPGTVITAHIHGDEEKFVLGSREMGAGTDLDVYSEQSPMGQAIMGLEAGDTTTFTAPNGAEIAVEIISIEPFIG